MSKRDVFYLAVIAVLLAAFCWMADKYTKADRRLGLTESAHKVQWDYLLTRLGNQAKTSKFANQDVPADSKEFKELKKKSSLKGLESFGRVTAGTKEIHDTVFRVDTTAEGLKIVSLDPCYPATVTVSNGRGIFDVPEREIVLQYEAGKDGRRGIRGLFSHDSSTVAVTTDSDCIRIKNGQFVTGKKMTGFWSTTFGRWLQGAIGMAGLILLFSLSS